MSSGNGGFSQILNFGNFLAETLIRGKFRRQVCLVENGGFLQISCFCGLWEGRTKPMKNPRFSSSRGTSTFDFVDFASTNRKKNSAV